MSEAGYTLGRSITSAVIELAGQAPHDELLAARVAAGVLGIDQSAISTR